MLIFAEKITHRLRYAVAQVLRIDDLQFTSDISAFHAFDGPKINYSHRRFQVNEVLIIPAGLLGQQGIHPQKIICSEWDGLKIFFQSGGDIPFDIFSATFFLLTRYEEYLPHEKDDYGRFAHTGSLAFREGFLQQPLVDQWRTRLLELLQHRFPEAVLPESTFQFLPTYDIDIAFANKGRGLLRSVLNRMRNGSVVQGRDAFDVYDWLDELHQSHSVHPVYFFLLARRRSQYDKNISVKSQVLRSLVERMASKYEIGIHPSWQSFFVEAELAHEQRWLQKLLKRTIDAGRQHYIQFVLPYTYRILLQHGITNEYSMGYGSINGFRASTCFSFPWYDLMEEKVTDLQIHPFAFMEANSFFEQHLSAEEAGEELQHFHDVVKSVNGTLITIFHNHFLTLQPQWLPWRQMYVDFLKRNF